METVGLFRTRVARDGAVEVWAKGWRLESQTPALVPAVIAGGFLLAPFGLPIRAFGASALVACALIVLRMSRLGFRVDAAGVQVVDVMRSTRVVWERFDGFMGERNEHEGRCVLLTTDGDEVRSPGTLDPDEMDPYWAEGDVSAVDQLNRLFARLRRALTAGAPVAPELHDPGRVDVPEADASGDGLSPGARRLGTLG
ncbi:MAG: hypothetical protein ACRDHI_06730 [Actinomycetota bacterium]